MAEAEVLQPRARVLHQKAKPGGRGAGCGSPKWAFISLLPILSARAPRSPSRWRPALYCASLSGSGGGAHKCIWQAPASSVSFLTSHRQTDQPWDLNTPTLTPRPWEGQLGSPGLCSHTDILVHAAEGKTLVELLGLSLTERSPRSPWGKGLFHRVACELCEREARRS